MSGEKERLDAAMAQVAKGNRSALASVYEMTSDKLFGTILRIVRSRERAEDLLQDVYVKVWRAAGLSTVPKAPRSPGFARLLATRR